MTQRFPSDPAHRPRRRPRPVGRLTRLISTKSAESRSAAMTSGTVCPMFRHVTRHRWISAARESIDGHGKVTAGAGSPTVGGFRGRVSAPAGMSHDRLIGICTSQLSIRYLRGRWIFSCFSAFLPKITESRKNGWILGYLRRGHPPDPGMGPRPHRDHRAVASGHADRRRRLLRDRPAARRAGGRVLVSRPHCGDRGPERPDGAAAGGGGADRLPAPVGVRAARPARAALHPDRDDHRPDDPGDTHRRRAHEAGRRGPSPRVRRAVLLAPGGALRPRRRAACGMRATACSR